MVNFGIIKDTFNNILSESIIRKNDEGKKIFKKYLKLLKENKILKTQYFIYKNLEYKKFNQGTDAKFYIKENIDLLKKLDKEKINKNNKKLLFLLKDEEMIIENSELYNHVDILVNTKKTPTTLINYNILLVI